MDTLLGDDARAPLAPPDPTRIGAFARRAPARGVGVAHQLQVLQRTRAPQGSDRRRGDLTGDARPATGASRKHLKLLKYSLIRVPRQFRVFRCRPSRLT